MHLNLMTRTPQRADEFTAGQKLTLAAGISQALSAFYTSKEEPPADNSENAR